MIQSKDNNYLNPLIWKIFPILNQLTGNKFQINNLNNKFNYNNNNNKFNYNNNNKFNYNNNNNKNIINSKVSNY